MTNSFYKKIASSFLLLTAVALLDACKPESLVPDETSIEQATDAKGNNAFTRKQIDDFMVSEAEKAKGTFNWATATDEMIWSAIKRSEDVLSVGYKIKSFDGKDLTKINLKEKEWQEARQKILTVVFDEEKKFDKNLKTSADLILFPESILPNLDLQVSQLSTIKKLRETGLITYLEPVGYRPESEAAKVPIDPTTPIDVYTDKGANARVSALAIGFGCGDANRPTGGLMNGSDYIQTSPNNSKMSWNHVPHGLFAAWPRGATGSGIKMAYFDTGLSDNQSLMLSNFWAGTQNRTLDKLVTLPKLTRFSAAETPNDPCGHGTQAASVGTAPRAGTSMFGIAYEANLVTIRVAVDVLFTTPREFSGVATAYQNVSQWADVKIISMSMGIAPIPYYSFANGQWQFIVLYNTNIANAVRLAHQSGKMIFGAAGTLPTGGLNVTIFPASMPEVIAVTGVKYDEIGNLVNASSYQYPATCTSCFYSTKVDFGVVMQKNIGGLRGEAKNPLCLTRTNNVEPATFGGSSCATASMAAMAAVVWSRYPNATRTEIFDKLKRHASHNNNRHSRIGWGLVNMDRATRSALVTD